MALIARAGPTFRRISAKIPVYSTLIMYAINNLRKYNICIKYA